MTGALLIGIYAFVLSVFLGVELINKVPSILHTPLMSGSNAISGITILGALTCVNSSSDAANWMGLIAIVLATINVVGGFLVTDRMLKMFRRS
jgi:NAD(P) transhydrogenase subunit alpha